MIAKIPITVQYKVWTVGVSVTNGRTSGESLNDCICGFLLTRTDVERGRAVAFLAGARLTLADLVVLFLGEADRFFAVVIVSSINHLWLKANSSACVFWEVSVH
jgi:hypothetical protein